MGLID